MAKQSKVLVQVPPVVPAPEKPPKQRSPNYPAISLDEAVDKLPKLFADMKRHPVGVETAVGFMGLKYTSSTGKLALGAMRSFGLFEDAGKSMVKLSSRALDIVTDYARSSLGWRKAVQDAALEPAIHKKLWERYGEELPADDELRRVLIRELKFYDNAVSPFIAEYKRTIEFSGLANGAPRENNGLPSIHVGDHVQWTSQGVDQFPTPQQVVGVSDDGEYAFVEGSNAGLPMSELTVIDPAVSAGASNPNSSPKPPPANPFFKPHSGLQTAGMRDFPIYYATAERGALYVPGKLNRKDFELLKKQIENHLAVIEATAVEDK
jgi:hypothetical protein